MTYIRGCQLSSADFELHHVTYGRETCLPQTDHRGFTPAQSSI